MRKTIRKLLRKNTTQWLWKVNKARVTMINWKTNIEVQHPVASPSPDYIPGLEDPQTPPVPHDEDEREPMFVQAIDPDTCKSLYTLSKYHWRMSMNDGDDDDGDSSRDDANDEDEDIEEEEEEEHLAPADSAIVVHVDEPVFHLRNRAWERLARCMALPAHSSPLLPSSGCPTQIQTLRITSTQALIDAVTAALPLPPSLYIPPPVDRRDDIPESEQPPRKRLCLSTLGSRYEVGESSTARPIRGRGIDYGFVSTVDAEERQQGIRDVGYGIRDTWVDPAEAVPEIAPMTVGEVNTRVTELAELHEHDTQDLYALLEDAQDSRSRISQRVDMDS
ncbi:hypothetical protein Tco_0651146 [Tanacetum coccineum]